LRAHPSTSEYLRFEQFWLHDTQQRPLRSSPTHQSRRPAMLLGEFICWKRRPQ
jgi:hypothetical protein